MSRIERISRRIAADRAAQGSRCTDRISLALKASRGCATPSELSAVSGSPLTLEQVISNCYADAREYDSPFDRGIAAYLQDVVDKNNEDLPILRDLVNRLDILDGTKLMLILFPEDLLILARSTGMDRLVETAEKRLINIDYGYEEGGILYDE